LTKIELYLNKPEYSLGDKVQGTFKISHDGWFDKPVEVKPFFEVLGEEVSTVIEKKTVTTTGTDGRPVTEVQQIPHTSKNTFFKKDLSTQLLKLGTLTSNGYILLEKGTKEIPFEFVLDDASVLLETYDGTNVEIYYKLNVVIDKKPFLALDTLKQLMFPVLGKKHNIQSNSVNEIEEDRLVKLNLKMDKDTISTSDSIKGQIQITNSLRTPIKNVEVGLRGIERATADNLIVESDLQNIRTEVQGNWTIGDIRDFEIVLPVHVKKSFRGKFSEYYWEIIVKADLGSPTRPDLLVKSRIYII
jgi:hypothetical protein